MVLPLKEFPPVCSTFMGSVAIFCNNLELASCTWLPSKFLHLTCQAGFAKVEMFDKAAFIFQLQ